MTHQRKLIGIMTRRVYSVCAVVTRLANWVWSNRRAEMVAAPVFIVGAPRTGSTVLYQALTNAYNLAYIDNTTCRWHRNLRFGMWLSNRKYGDSPHNNFKADHGNTQRFGGHAPSECGGFWYRWLPRDRHFIDYQDITLRMIEELRAEVFGVINYLEKPLLFKNLNAGQRLRLIHRAFPSAKIIFIRRDPRFVIRSLLDARRKVGVKPGNWWSIMPPNVLELLSLPEPEMCAAQVYFVEKQIEEDLALFPAENIREIHYRDLQASVIQDLARWIGVHVRPGGALPKFFEDDTWLIDNHHLDELDRLTAKFPFRKDLFV